MKVFTGQVKTVVQIERLEEKRRSLGQQQQTLETLIRDIRPKGSRRWCAAKDRIDQNLAELHAVKKRIKKLKDKQGKKIRPLVTEHALVRYIERALDIDVEKVRKEILDERCLELMGQLNYTNAEYPTKRGYTVVLRDGKIVTVKG